MGCGRGLGRHFGLSSGGVCLVASSGSASRQGQPAEIQSRSCHHPGSLVAQPCRACARRWADVGGSPKTVHSRSHWHRGLGSLLRPQFADTQFAAADVVQTGIRCVACHSIRGAPGLVAGRRCCSTISVGSVYRPPQFNGSDDLWRTSPRAMSGVWRNIDHHFLQREFGQCFGNLQCLPANGGSPDPRPKVVWRRPHLGLQITQATAMGLNRVSLPGRSVCSLRQTIGRFARRNAVDP